MYMIMSLRYAMHVYGLLSRIDYPMLQGKIYFVM